MRKFLFYFLFFLCNKVHSQNTFLKEFGTQYGHAGGSKFIETRDYSIVCIGGFNPNYFVSNSSSSYICKLTSTGDTLWARALGNNGTWYHEGATNIIETKDSAYLILGACSNSSTAGTYPCGIEMYKYDKNGTLLWKKITDTGFWAPQNIIECSDSSLLCVCTSYGGSSDNDSSLQIIRFNSSGTLLSMKTLRSTNKIQAVQIISFENSFFISGRALIPDSSFNDDFNSICIIKIDSSLAPVWAFSYSVSTLNRMSLIKAESTPDGRIMTHAYFSENNFNNYNFFLQLDGAGIPVLSQRSDNFFVYDYCLNMDSTWSFMGAERDPASCTACVRGNYFVKTDLHLDTILLTRSYDSVTQILYFFSESLHQVFDNGFLSCVYSHNNPNTSFALLKVDSLLRGDCPYTSPDTFSFYTTPVIVDTLTLNTIANSIYSQQQLFGQEFPFSFDDITEPCNFTFIESNTNREIAVISPNPFHTTATLHISDAGFKDTELKIYNTMGALVREASLSFGEGRGEAKIDRGDLADGLYFYHLTNNEFRASGKFVIE